MSRGASMTVELVLTMEQAERMMEDFQRRWSKLNVQPTVGDPGEGGSTTSQGSPASTPTATFGGHQVRGDPSSWRQRDPAAGRIKEPNIFGQPFSQLPPAMQQAIAAQDPVSAAWLKQQQGPPPMTPAEIRQAEKFHQWNVRNLEYENTQRIKREDRQERDEQFADKQRIQEARAENRRRTSDENRQHRDESFVDRRDFGDYKRSVRERVSAENRQERDERALASSESRYSRSSFQADLAEMYDPRDRAEAIRGRMTGLDPASMEYQALRRQLGQTNRQLGWNRTILPSHAYMQLMFGAYDVAATAGQVSREGTAALYADTQIGALQHQLSAVTGGGGILSSIVKEGWNAIGLATGGAVRSPAGVEAVVASEVTRAALLNANQQAFVANRAGALQRQFSRGTFQSRYAAAAAAQLQGHAPLDLENQELTNLIRQDPGTFFFQSSLDAYNATTSTRQQRQRVIASQKRAIDDQRAYEESEIWQDYQDTVSTIRGQTGVSSLVASGAGQRSIGRAQLKLQQQQEYRKARRERDPALLMELDALHMAQMEEYEYVSSKREGIQDLGTTFGVAVLQANAKRDPFSASVFQLLGSTGQSFIGAESPRQRQLALATLTAGMQAIGSDFIHRGTSTAYAANMAALSYDQLAAGDPIGAIKTNIAAQRQRALDDVPQGFFRWLVEPAINKQFQSMETYQIKQVNDQRFIQRETLQLRRDVARDESKGLIWSAQADLIYGQGKIASDAYMRENRKDMAQLAVETSGAQLEALQRHMRIRQFTEGSAEEVAPGTLGPGGTSTVPRELENQTLDKGLQAVKDAIDENNRLLSSVLNG